MTEVFLRSFVNPNYSALKDQLLNWVWVIRGTTINTMRFALPRIVGLYLRSEQRVFGKVDPRLW